MNVDIRLTGRQDDAHRGRTRQTGYTGHGTRGQHTLAETRGDLVWKAGAGAAPFLCHDRDNDTRDVLAIEF